MVEGFSRQRRQPGRGLECWPGDSEPFALVLILYLYSTKVCAFEQVIEPDFHQARLNFFNSRSLVSLIHTCKEVKAVALCLCLLVSWG